MILLLWLAVVIVVALVVARALNIPHFRQMQRKQPEYIPSMGLGLGVGSEGAAGEKNMHDAEFTCALFRFIQLTCEGHNLGKITIYYMVFCASLPLVHLIST